MSYSRRSAIKYSPRVRDYIFYTETLNAKKMTENEYESTAEAYLQEHKDEPYEVLSPYVVIDIIENKISLNVY